MTIYLCNKGTRLWVFGLNEVSFVWEESLPLDVYFLGVPLDLLLRIEISCASVSVVEWGDYGPWMLGVNFTGEIEMPY